MRRPDLAEQISPFEVLSTQPLTEGHPMVARLIGRRFDQVLEDLGYERPFDARFGKMMVKTLAHLCATLGCSFGFCERTEMSLYAVGGGGEARRLVSRIAGEAAAKLSLLLGEVATFEVRLYEFDTVEAAWEYFAWRGQEAQGDALDAWAQAALVAGGSDLQAVPMILEGMAADEKAEILRQRGIDYAALPDWQRLGGTVHVTGDGGGNARLTVDLRLPGSAEFPDYLRRVLA